MKKINLKGISEILSEKELKNVMGGSVYICYCGSATISINASSLVAASQALASVCCNSFAACHSS